MPLFTKSERFILCKQYEILVRLIPERREWYEGVIAALKNGFEKPLEEELEDFADPMSIDDCVEVERILRLFHLLQSEIGRTSELGSGGEPLYFPGFSDCDESKQYRYAAYLEASVGFSGFPLVNGNMISGIPLLPLYRDMLEYWDNQGRRSRGLSVEQIRTLTNMVTQTVE